MADKTWEVVDQYFLGKIIGQDAALEEAQRAAEAAGLLQAVARRTERSDPIPT